MTPQTILTPFRHSGQERTGKRTFRKQLLPLEKPIAYKGKTLSFSKAYLDQVAANFNAGAYDQVPAVLADDENRHNESPENFRGEVKAVELTDKGLDVVVEMTEKGADLIADNPRLGVSARLVPNLERGDRSFENVLRHVCLTLDPRANGLRAWEVVSNDSVLSHVQSSEETLDFSSATYPDEMPDTQTLTDEHLETLKGLSGDERDKKARELLDVKADDSKTEPDKKETTEPEKKGGKVADFMRSILPKSKSEGLSDQDLEQAFTDLKTDAEKAESKDDKEPATALSDDDRKVIDLARDEAQAARRETAEANWKLERKEFSDAGVPPAMLDLAEPILKSGQKASIDLSASEKADAADVIRKLLDNAKGTVDLSKEKGSAEDDERTDAKDKAKRFGEENA